MNSSLLEILQMSWGFWVFQEVTFLNLLGGNSVSQIPGSLFEGELYTHMHWLLKVNRSSLKLSGHIWFCAHHFQMWHSSQSLGNITNVYNCVLSQGEQILFEFMQITILPWNYEYLLRVSKFSRDQIGRKDTCFNSVYKGIIYQNTVWYK